MGWVKPIGECARPSIQPVDGQIALLPRVGAEQGEGACVLGARRGIGVARGWRFRREVAEFIHPAHQDRRRAAIAGLNHMGRDVADAEAEPAVAAVVGIGAVHRVGVVQR